MNVPKLRFKEFTDEWLILKENIKILSGNMYPLSAYNDTGVLLIQGLNIYPKKLNLDKPIYISNEFNAVKHLIVQKDDILIGLNRPIINNELKICKFMYDYAYLYQRAGVLSFNKSKINTDCLYQYLQSYQFIRKLSTELVGSDQPYIKSNLFNVVKIYFPKLAEQKKIANFLSTIDKKISNLEDIITNLEKQKKGLLQKIFNQELRFKDENGNNYPDWEKKKLGDILKDFYLGGNYKNSTKITKYPLLKMGNLDRGKINLNKIEYIEENEPINERDKIHFGDLFFNTRNTPDLVGKVAIWRNELPLMYFNSNLMKMTFDNNFFMNYKFNTKKVILKLRSIATGTTSVGAIYTKDLLKLELNIPCLEEQTKIADFLSAFDRKIDNQKAQLEHWQQIKKGLLQQMFV